MAGFDFDNVLRNNSLANKNLHLPKATSTGTTIVGCLFEGGIILGADTRATEGPIVADKNCEKVSSAAPGSIAFRGPRVLAGELAGLRQALCRLPYESTGRLLYG